MISRISKYFLLTGTVILAGSCTKEIPPELQSSNKQKLTDEQKMPDDSIHRKFKSNPHQSSNSENEQEKTESKNEEWNDEKADKFTKVADEADAMYMKTRSANDKINCITKQLMAANYLMFDADLPPKEKYKPALQRYKRVLELDPGNKEAIANKEQIEEIYRSLGKPIPN